MNPSPHRATRWRHLKHAGLVLVFLILLALLTVAGARINHASQGAVPTGGLMAPGDPPVITHHTVSFGIAPHIGERAATTGSLMAPAPAGSGDGDGGPAYAIGSNGDIHIGG